MRILLYLIAAVALAGCTTPHEATPFFKASDSRIVWSGRTVADSAGAVRFNFPGVTARVRFEGPSLAMATSPGSGYFVVEVDSMAPRKVFYGPSDSLLTLVDSLGHGVHDARIVYAVEGYEFRPEVRGFSAGSLQQAPAPRGPKIEFVGNSITCGYGTEATDGSTPFSYATENHTLTYAYLTARALDADVCVVARSGIGVYRNYNGPLTGDTIGTMPLEYERTMIYEPEPRWDFTRFNPDIVCINLGTNDLSTANYDGRLFEEAFGRFVDTVRGHYPDARIVLLTGSMLRGEELRVASEALDRVAGTRPGVTRFDMTPQDGSLGYGADYHPSARQARQMAGELTDYLLTL